MECHIDGRVRWATRADISAIERIANISAIELGELMTRGEMIVLANGSEILGAACLTTNAGHGHLAFVATVPGSHGVEARMRAIASALSQSERCEPEFEAAV